MKPKTIIEKQITALSASLAPIASEVHRWAEKIIFLKWCALSRGKFHCLDCTHSWKPNSTKQTHSKFMKCTACNGKLKVYGYNQVHFKEIEYCAVLDTCGEYQVVRIICSNKLMKKNCLPNYFHKEVMQHWINSNGEVRTMSLSTNVFSNAYDAWQYGSTLEIRPKEFENSPKYRINPYRIFPKLKVLSILKRNGFKNGCYTIAPQILFTALLSDFRIETLLKARQTKLLCHYLQSNEQGLNKNWQAVKTCLKNKYVIEDIKIWEDYIELLRWFNKDLSCAKLVCPEHLNQAHDKLVLKKRTLQRKIHLQEMRNEILNAQTVYAEEKKPFFGLAFSNEKITISVLENVQDFMEEGDSLNHCLFTNEYYNKKDSLILSARVDNIPIETIEFSLSEMKIVQCRGLKNKKSRHHKMIVNLMKKNLYQVRCRLKNQKQQIE